jgi:hypothetical protein
MNWVEWVRKNPFPPNSLLLKYFSVVQSGHYGMAKQTAIGRGLCHSSLHQMSRQVVRALISMLNQQSNGVPLSFLGQAIGGVDHGLWTAVCYRWCFMVCRELSTRDATTARSRQTLDPSLLKDQWRCTRHQEPVGFVARTAPKIAPI